MSEKRIYKILFVKQLKKCLDLKKIKTQRLNYMTNEAKLYFTFTYNCFEIC